MRTVGWVALGLLVGGCSATTMAPDASAQAGAAPENYRAAALASIKETYFDPYSVRDASISQLLYASTVFDGITPIPRKGWIVCVKGNAKNRMGGYAGMQTTVLLFQGEAVVFTLDGPDYAGQIADHCKSATYQPFTELEALT